MPEYQFFCQNCRKYFDVYFSYSEYGSKKPQCPHCLSSNVVRKIGRVRFARSEENHLEIFDGLSDPSALASLGKDPKELGRFMQKMSGEMGEDLGPEFNEVVDRLEKGQSPEEIEKELPDLGNPSGDEYSSEV